jgi:hypothetical protein
MRAVLFALGVAAGIGIASAAYAEIEEPRQAWFVSNYETKQWCAFVDEASASTAADDDRLDWSVSARLTYGVDQPVTLLVALQSEDAYVEDSYSFAPDLSLIQVVRMGHYVSDPFFTATYRPDDAGELHLTAESVEAVGNWDYTTYFLDWPIYRSFGELPFAALIETTPQVSVWGNC